MNAIVEAKQRLRVELRRRRAEMLSAERDAAARRLAQVFARDVAGEPGAVVAGYMPIRGEIDPAPLMRALERRGLLTALPRVVSGDLTFHLSAGGASLVRGAFGILEPAADAPQVQPTILLVPLLAFDRRGGRLGYGAGYYDRAMARLSPVVAIGLAFALQEVSAVPMEPHDRRLDRVLTEQGPIDCRGGPGA